MMMNKFDWEGYLIITLYNERLCLLSFVLVKKILISLVHRCGMDKNTASARSPWQGGSNLEGTPIS